MQAILIPEPGGPEVLTLCQVATPVPGKGEVRVIVRATAVNRADVLQRRGKYPAPPDAPADIPGLEFAGVVDALGEGVQEVKQGDQVFGLASGGCYAEYVVVNARCLAKIPAVLSFAEAAAVPEAFITAWDAMIEQSGLVAGETVLVSAVGSGVGTAAVQIARAVGARSIGTARCAAKLERAAQLGMDHGLLLSGEDFASSVLELTQGQGVDVVLELVGGNYLSQDIKCMAQKARLSLVGLVAGASCQLDLGSVLKKRLTIRGTTLRMRPLEEKISAGRLLVRHLVPLFASGALKPVVDHVFPLAQAAEAHALMERNDNFGKIVLEISGSD